MQCIDIRVSSGGVYVYSGFIQDLLFFFVRHTLNNNNIMMYNHVLASQMGCVCWGGGRGTQYA